MITNINKLISVISEAHFDGKLTWEEMHDGIQAIWLSPHLGESLSDNENKEIDKFFEMKRPKFFSDLNPNSRRHDIEPVWMRNGYGTYDEQNSRLAGYWEWLKTGTIDNGN